jgi:Domain of unknown function (DUF4326)
MPEVKRRAGLYGKIPEGGVFVGRPSRWGNPWKVGADGTREEVIERYRQALLAGELRVTVEEARRDLRGKDLYCYCAPEPCHGDVLLEVANG